MTLVEVNNILAATGMPVAYHSYPTGNVPNLPYIVYLVTRNNNFVADDSVYMPFKHIQVELYTKQKNETAEGKVETALNSAHIVWGKTETFIDSEKVYQTIYEIEV